MIRAVPWAAVGFAVGVGAGLVWAKTATTKGPDGKTPLSRAVTTDWKNGIFTARVNTLTAAKAGIPDALDFLDRYR